MSFRSVKTPCVFPIPVVILSSAYCLGKRNCFISADVKTVHFCVSWCVLLCLFSVQPSSFSRLLWVFAVLDPEGRRCLFYPLLLQLNTLLSTHSDIQHFFLPNPVLSRRFCSVGVEYNVPLVLKV